MTQRLDALARANDVRLYRARLKLDVRQARADADEVLASVDPRLAAMRAYELVLAVPGVGRVRADGMFRRLGIGTSRMIGELTPRQIAELRAALRAACRS